MKDISGERYGVPGLLGRAVLGKSSGAYMNAHNLAGSGRYWDDAIEAQLGWPHERPSSTPSTRMPKNSPSQSA